MYDRPPSGDDDHDVQGHFAHGPTFDGFARNGRNVGGPATAMNLPPIRLVCLDLAGTTVADGGVVERAFAQALLETDVEPGSAQLADALAHVRATMGRSKLEVFRAVFDGDEDRAVAANVCFERAYDASVHRGEVGPVPGAVEVMERLRGAGIAVCITTGFSVATRDALLESLCWQDVAHLVLSPEDAGRGRPYHDMILTAVVRLGIDDVRQVAVVGDTANDLLAGARAGASIVAGVLTGAHDRDQPEAAPHTHVLDSVADLPDVVFRTCRAPRPVRLAAGL